MFISFAKFSKNIKKSKWVAHKSRLISEKDK